MDIRKALLTKLHNSSPDELKEIINGGIASKEETIVCNRMRWFMLLAVY